MRGLVDQQNASDHGVAAMDIEFRNDDDGNSRASHCYASIAIGNNAGGGFQKDGSLQCAYHATRTCRDGRIEKGYFVKKKWLVDRAAFNYCPTMGWAHEHWFEWPDSDA